MAAYLERTGRAAAAALCDRHAADLRADDEVAADPAKYFDRVIEIDLTTLEPHLVGPHTPDLGHPMSAMAADVEREGYPRELSYALIGSCTNSSYEDMGRAAQVVRQALDQGLKLKVPLMVSPGSEQIYSTIERDGQMQTLLEAGAIVLSNACGPCIGQWKREGIERGKPNSIVTSFNRNFRRRNDGNPDTLAFIGSPEMVIALAVAGRIDFNPVTDELEASDGRRFKLAPPEAPELPERGFVEALEGYEAPAADATKVHVTVDPRSDRLQLLERFAAWEGKDLTDLVVLLKAVGKCTTDHISPAGPWLRFRGHLDHISDNMFIGAVNAFTEQPGTANDVLGGGEPKPIPEVARSYKARGQGWVVFGDENYGEGSSREHAAMSPRFLGARAAIVRSFARIHETNLKKQGVLPLTFADPADYGKIQQKDRVAIVGLPGLTPGKPLRVRLAHEDGTSDEFEVNHTLSEAQISWFRAGSSLNALAQR
jgi:aconitate hydratase